MVCDNLRDQIIFWVSYIGGFGFGIFISWYIKKLNDKYKE